MKIFAIKNEYDNSEPVAFLIYFEAAKKFYVEITDSADEWQVPFAFLGYVKKGIRTINPTISLRWVRERIIPSDRQNISQILRDNGLKYYDEFELLKLGHGRCAQDDYCIIPIAEDNLPADIRIRNHKRVDDIFPLEDSKSLLVFFKDGKAKICKLKSVIGAMPALQNYLTQFPELINDVKIQAGGYGICWNDNMMISDSELYRCGQNIPLSKKDLMNFIVTRVVNSAEAAQILNCSRQNIDDLVKRKKLTPIKETAKDKWFLKSDVLKREWK